MHPIVKEGYPFIFYAAGTALAAFYLGGLPAAIPFAVLALYFSYFFRNPKRNAPKDGNILYAPADGTVMGVEDIFDNEYLDAPAKKVTIFLSVLNVHVNRSPMDGEINYRRYTCGHYAPAYKDSAPFENERHAIGIENDGMRILVIQIAGILARCIVSWVDIGQKLTQGQCYGMIKFGSCTELIVPQNVTINVRKGDKVTGGVTVIGKIEK